MLLITQEKDCFLDFNGGSIKSLIFNGQTYTPEEIEQVWRENKIHLKIEHYKPVGTANVLELVAQNSYNNDQFGMVLVKDPNGDRYRYIQTVPYYASRVVPMFDQPNLKGSYAISILHSSVDIGVTTGKQVSSTPVDKLDAKSTNWAESQVAHFKVEIAESVFTHFEKTPYLSSYNLNLVCGPLVCFPADPDQTHRGIPMNLYCRSKLSPHAQKVLLSTSRTRRTTSTSSKSTVWSSTSSSSTTSTRSPSWTVSSAQISLSVRWSTQVRSHIQRN